MPGEFEGAKSRRRYERATGPFEGFLEDQSMLVYDLNLGGGFVNTPHQPQIGSRLVLRISLPQEGWITVNAEALYQHEHGFAVCFHDLDPDAAARIARTVESLKRHRGF